MHWPTLLALALCAGCSPEGPSPPAPPEQPAPEATGEQPHADGSAGAGGTGGSSGGKTLPAPVDDFGRPCSDTAACHIDGPSYGVGVGDALCYQGRCLFYCQWKGLNNAAPGASYACNVHGGSCVSTPDGSLCMPPLLQLSCKTVEVGIDT
jgi:hypothetical protein